MKDQLPMTNYQNYGRRASAPVGHWSLVIGHSGRSLGNNLRGIVVVVLLASACSAPIRTWTPPLDPATLDDTAFLHYLATAPTVTVQEGGRAVLLLSGPTSRLPTWEEQKARLADLRALKPQWRLSPDQTLDKGTLAFMVAAACRVPPGLNDLLADVTGLGDRRSALKRCVDAGLITYGLPHDPVSGGELVLIVTRAESWTETHARNEP